MRYCHSTHSATSAWTRACLLIVGLSVLASWPAFAQVARSMSPITAFTPDTPHEIQSGEAKLVGHYDPNQKLRLVIALLHPNVLEERQFLEDLQTVGKKEYHQYLTAEEWNRRFAPSAEAEQAVVDWAKSQGLTVTNRFANRLLVDVEAPASTIEKAFNVTMNNYQLGTKTVYSNDRDATIPSHLTGIVLGVTGLNSMHVMHPMNKNMHEPAFADYSEGPALASGASGHGDGDRSKLAKALKASRASQNSSGGVAPNYDSGPPYDPRDMFSTAAYSVGALNNLGHCCNPNGNPGVTPPETSIAIATAGTQNGSDFAGFFATFNYMAYHWQQWYIDGTPACCDGEGTMDMEWSQSMANSFGSYVDTSMIYLYDGVNSSFGVFDDIYNYMLSNGYARNMTTSWGCVELYCYDATDMAITDGIFGAMTAQGWSLTAASGDQGSTAGCSDLVAVQYPSSDPYVTAAGGATLYMYGGPPPSFYGLYGWSGGPDGCGSNDGGSTGGYSSYFGAPGYQSGFPSRGVPDIALNADWYNTPQWLYFGGGWGGNGGTSIVAPETAGFFAQENAYLLSLGNICGGSCAPMGYANPLIYGAITYNQHPPFYDITSGCNNNDVTTYYGLGYYCAASGWDAVTGLGTYNFLQLAWAINWQHVPGYSYPVVTFNGNGYNANTWYNSDPYITWTISAPPADSYPSPGTSGFTQMWDADPGNPHSEATPGYSGFPSNPYNAYYDGPEYANATSGCLDLLGYYCANAVGAVQGWHTVNVRSWGNEGENGGDYTYGPIGYDTIAPTTTASLSGTLIGGTNYKSAVKVTLTATDPGYSASPRTGSGINVTYYYLNSGPWQVYSGPFTVGYTGSYTVHFESYDNAGNLETTKTTAFTIKPVLSLSGATLAFGNEVLGTTSAGKTVTITNITTSAVPITSITAFGDFNITSNTCGSTLAGSGHCTVTVTFKPSVLGAITGDLTIGYSAIGSPDRLNLTGTGLAPLKATPTSLAFGTETVGLTTAAKTVTLKNDNPSTSLSLGISSNGDYAVAAGGTCGATLAGGASCTVNVTFKPHQNGAINGELTVTDGVSLSPLVVGMSGSGTGGVANPLSFTPATLSFTNAVVGTTTPKTVTVKNTSASSVTVSSVSASGDYTASGCVTTLISGATCTLTVNFTPTTNGTIKGAIALTDGTSVSPEVLNATGTAVLPITITPVSISFGTLTVGTTSGSHTVTLTNHTAGSLSLTIGASGDFATGGGTCAASLAAGASCTFGVTFTPTTTGAISGAATVAYPAGYSPQEVKLSGTGN